MSLQIELKFMVFPQIYLPRFRCQQSDTIQTFIIDGSFSRGTGANGIGEFDNSQSVGIGDVEMVEFS
jgi:hypothetical protein